MGSPRLSLLDRWDEQDDSGDAGAGEHEEDVVDHHIERIDMRRLTEPEHEPLDQDRKHQSWQKNSQKQPERQQPHTDKHGRSEEHSPEHVKRAADVGTFRKDLVVVSVDQAEEEHENAEESPAHNGHNETEQGHGNPFRGCCGLSSKRNE